MTYSIEMYSNAKLKYLVINRIITARLIEFTIILYYFSLYSQVVLRDTSHNVIIIINKFNTKEKFRVWK